jgi:hypothetical protein
MCSQPLIIRLAATSSPTAATVKAPPFAGACCRHHLDARTRLHNMVRGRRVICVPRLRVPMTPRDLALNRAEIFRVVAIGNLDFASARTMLWAMDLAATGLRAQYNLQLRRALISTRKPNKIYQVQISHMLSQSYTQNPTELIENTRAKGEGVYRAESHPGLEPAAVKYRVIATRTQ